MVLGATQAALQVVDLGFQARLRRADVQDLSRVLAAVEQHLHKHLQVLRLDLGRTSSSRISHSYKICHSNIIRHPSAW